ncbi:hypothetical protein D3C76_582380 [compost metagenome]
MGAVVVHHRIGGGRSQLADVHRIGVVGTRSHTCDLAAAAIVEGDVAELRRLCHLQMDRPGQRIGHSLQVGTRVAARRAGLAADSQGFTQITMHGIAFITGELQALGSQAVTHLVELIEVHRVATILTLGEVGDPGVVHVDTTHSDARTIVDGQAGVVDQGIAHGDAVDIQVPVEGDSYLAVLVRTALGYADVAVATEGDRSVRADVGAVAVGVADVPAGRGQVPHISELIDVHRIATVHAGREVGDPGVIHVDAAHSDARAIVDGQAGVVDQGVAHSDAVEVQVTVESDGHLAVLVRTALGHADVAVATEGNVAVRADVGAVAVGVADVPAGRGQVPHISELIDVHRIATVHAGREVGDPGVIHVDAAHSDARAIVDGQAGVVDQGVAHSDAVEVQVTVESDGHLAVLVRTALGHADVAVATEGNVAVRADVGAVAVGVADVPAGRGQIGHALELRHVDGIGLLQTCGHTGDLASLSGSRIAYADGTQSALPGSAGIGGS